MKLAFIGLGAIGKPMSQRLIDNGYDLNLYQRNKLNNDAKRKYFFDPIEAVSDCDGLLICVTDDNAVESVLFGDNGVSGSLKPNSFVIDFSTISPDKSISIHKRLGEQNIFYVDCPVSGGTEGAHNGSLSLFIGASEKDCLSFENIFQVLGKSINYFNGVGKGQQVKALNQILVAGTYAAVAEAMELGKMLELPMDDVVAALKVGAIVNNVEKTLREEADMLPLRKEGINEAKWALLDYGDIIINVFQPNERKFYDLESFWSNGINHNFINNKLIALMDG